MKNIPVFIAIILIFFLFSAQSVLAQVQATVNLSSNTVYVHEPFTLSIEVRGSTQLSPPQLQNMDAFDHRFRSSSSSMIIQNGNIESSTTYKYLVTALKEGDYKIGNAIIQAGNAKIETTPVSITVLEAITQKKTPSSGFQTSPFQPQSPQIQPSQVPPVQPKLDTTAEPDILFEARVDKDILYKFQHLTYTIYLYNRKDVTSVNLEVPEFENFLVEELPEKPKYIRSINGKQYYVYEQSYSLKPTKTGVLTIPKAHITGTVLASSDPIDLFFDNYYNKAFRLESRPITINVKELPTPPSDFQNLIGSFKFSAKANKYSLKTGETVQLKLKIWGEGNLETAENIEFPFPEEIQNNFRIYKQPVKVTFTNQTDKKYGTAVFLYDLVPVKQGMYKISPFSLTYFDPMVKAYKTVDSEQVNIYVEKGESTESLDLTRKDSASTDSAKHDIIPVKTTSKGLKTQQISIIDAITLTFLFILPELAYLGCLVFAYIQKNEKFKSVKTTLGSSNKAISSIDQLVRQKNIDNKTLVKEIEKVFRDFIKAKLTLDAKSLTVSDYEKQLKNSSKNDFAVEEAIKLLLLFEKIQYASLPVSDSELHELAAQTKTTIKILNKELNR